LNDLIAASVRRLSAGFYTPEQIEAASDPRLDPQIEPARIRAFFVHPTHARRGLARRIYTECERAARSAGFRRFELMATLPGEPLYLALGFTVEERVILAPDGVPVPFARMSRNIESASDAVSAAPAR